MPRDETDGISRRTVVKSVAAASTAGLLAGCAGGAPTAEETDGSGGDVAAETATARETGGSEGGAGEPASFDGWFDDVSNYDGVLDATGRDAVTVDVGVEGNQGAFAFGPAAVRVDAGTTVTWEWTGNGGVHNVAAEDGSFESETVEEAGYTFEQTFETAGEVRYVCTPHRSLGMKGIVVVE
jgi:halocyanin-like protein